MKRWIGAIIIFLVSLLVGGLLDAYAQQQTYRELPQQVVPTPNMRRQYVDPRIYRPGDLGGSRSEKPLTGSDLLRQYHRQGVEEWEFKPYPPPPPPGYKNDLKLRNQKGDRVILGPLSEPFVDDNISPEEERYQRNIHMLKLREHMDAIAQAEKEFIEMVNQFDKNPQVKYDYESMMMKTPWAAVPRSGWPDKTLLPEQKARYR